MTIIKILLFYNEIDIASQISNIDGGPDGQWKFITYPLKMPVSYQFHSKVSKENTVWKNKRGCSYKFLIHYVSSKIWKPLQVY